MMRIGYGYDVHRLVEGRRLVLGGVEIDHTSGLLGHSDADVLLHAIVDAILGAAALGDIGSHFPDTADRWRDADCSSFARYAAEKIELEGYRVANIDATVVAERPKIGPHVDAMRSRIAELLGVDVTHVSVKATTSEGMGFVGERRGIAAHAVCLLEKI